MKIYYHPRFRISYRNLPKAIQGKAEQKEKIFRENPFEKSLKAHKLHGKLKNLWSFYVDARYRIIFEFDKADITFLDIGDHSLYQ